MDVITQLVLPKCEGIKPSAGSWMVRCPAHEDGRASLHISRGTSQPVVFKCHAGCETEDILAAFGLTWEALCGPREERPVAGEWTPHGPAVATYDYTDESGELLFQVLRTADKQFPQRVPDASRKSGWRWQIGDTRRVIYRLPKLIEAVADGEWIWVVEGEKDVHALEAAGITATCCPGGAGKWRPEYAPFFAGAIVRVVADKDKPGQAHARQVAASLEGIAAAVEIAEAAEGKDAADHLAAGLKPSEFVVTKEAETPAAPELAQDLVDFIAGTDEAEDWVIPGLLERGDRLIWTGLEGLGKTVVTRQLAIGAATGIHPFTDTLFPPRRVLFIDCENPIRKSRRRFRELAWVTDHKHRPLSREQFRIMHRPAGIDLSREEERDWLIERVTAHKPDLLVIGPLYKLHALDVNEELAARAITAVLDQARVQADCAVIIEAHAPHGDNNTRALRPAGSSLFMRWPEFGYGIRRAPKSETYGNETRRRVVVQAWRGPREERQWPRLLGWGEEDFDWPWVVLPDERDEDEKPALRAVPESA